MLSFLIIFFINYLCVHAVQQRVSFFSPILVGNNMRLTISISCIQSDTRNDQLSGWLFLLLICYLSTLIYSLSCATTGHTFSQSAAFFPYETCI